MHIYQLCQCKTPSHCWKNSRPECITMLQGLCCRLHGCASRFFALASCSQYRLVRSASSTPADCSPIASSQPLGRFAISRCAIWYPDRKQQLDDCKRLTSVSDDRPLTHPSSALNKLLSVEMSSSSSPDNRTSTPQCCQSPMRLRLMMALTFCDQIAPTTFNALSDSRSLARSHTSSNLEALFPTQQNACSPEDESVYSSCGNSWVRKVGDQTHVLYRTATLVK